MVFLGSFYLLYIIALMKYSPMNNLALNLHIIHIHTVKLVKQANSKVIKIWILFNDLHCTEISGIISTSASSYFSFLFCHCDMSADKSKLGYKGFMPTHNFRLQCITAKLRWQPNPTHNQEERVYLCMLTHRSLFYS